MLVEHPKFGQLLRRARKRKDSVFGLWGCECKSREKPLVGVFGQDRAGTEFAFKQA